MQYNDVLLAPSDRTLLDGYVKQPSHALLLGGGEGSGLATIAMSLALELVEKPSAIEHINPDEKGTISIETVRSLYNDTRSIHKHAHVIVVDDVDGMSREAQNAFLKLLEEPTVNTYFILTSHQPQLLLPTISSRAQHVGLHLVSHANCLKLLSTLGVHDEITQQRMMFIAEGLPAELTRLAADKVYFEEQSEYVRAARALMSAPLYERIVLLNAYNDRTKAVMLMRVLSRVITFMLARNSDDKLLKAAEVTEQTAVRLAANGHVKTQLLSLACSV